MKKAAQSPSSLALESHSVCCTAANLSFEQRKKLAVRVIAHTEQVTRLARQNGVSRKFLYHQAAKANHLLDQAFSEKKKDDNEVLFYLPVTKTWLKQVVLALILICRSSYRGAIEFLCDLIGVKMCVGTIHNIVKNAVKSAQKINKNQVLSKVRVSSHDEIFQSGKPVLAGVDLDSTYCYLLSQEEQRDSDTWGIHLLELTEQGLNPQHVIADGGLGLRAGLAAAMPSVPCHGDVFHILRDFGRLRTFLERRAFAAISAREKLERKMESAKKNAKGQKWSKKLAIARAKEEKDADLSENISILADWMQNDILSLAGPGLKDRQELFDFAIKELHKLEPLCEHRIRPMRRSLENQRDSLLAFVGVLDEKFEQISKQFKIAPYYVQSICELQSMDKTAQEHQQFELMLRGQLRWRFHDVEQAVINAMEDTPRASSCVENFNSRLRNYFFLRKYIGSGYLDLLRFYLNHKIFIRSRHNQRVGKSAAELLTGEKHPHWLNMLGFTTFQPQAA